MIEMTPQQLVQLHVRRLEACWTTISTVHAEVFDPLDPDLRADLLIQSENVANAAVALALEIRALVWPDTSDSPLDDHLGNRKVD